MFFIYHDYPLCKYRCRRVNMELLKLRRLTIIYTVEEETEKKSIKLFDYL